MHLLRCACCLWLPVRQILALKALAPAADAEDPLSRQSKRHADGLVYRHLGLGADGQALKAYWGESNAAIWRESRGGVSVHAEPGLPQVSEPCNDMDVWGNLSFTLTRAMCSKTRPHRSNSASVQEFLTKLHQGKCINLVALGGSVTFGNCMTCPPTMRLPNRLKVTWPAQLTKWLNVKFPCSGDGHKVWNMGVPARDSDYWQVTLASWRNDPSHPIFDADMVIVDTAINDMQNNMDPVPMLRITETQRPEIEKRSEGLWRLLRALPKRPWLISAEVAWGYWQPRTGGEGHVDAAVAHLPVLQHYDVDQVSLIDTLIPLTGDPRREWIEDFLYVEACHPNVLGQMMIAQILGHTIMEEDHNNDADPLPKAGMERLPPPLFLDAEVAELFDNGPVNVASMEEDQPLLKSAWEIKGFTAEAERMVSTTEGSSLGLAIELPHRPNRTKGLLKVGYMRNEKRGVFQINFRALPGSCADASQNFDYWEEGPSVDKWWIPASDLRSSKTHVFRANPEDGCLMVRIVSLTGVTAPDQQNMVMITDVTVV